MSSKDTSLEDFLAAMQMAGANHLQIGKIGASHSALIRELENYNAPVTAATIGGLLTLPELQSNCLRLEVLLHLVLAYGNTRRKPLPKLLTRAFTELGTGICGTQEDPAEDVFVTQVSTSRGNYRLFEGIWESAGFHLQRVLNVLDITPNFGKFERLKESVQALLKISETVAARSSLRRYTLGNEKPQRTLPPALVKDPGRLRRRLKFARSDLDHLGINDGALEPFIFSLASRQHLTSEEIGTSTLERRPLLAANDAIYLLLPTAVSPAIRQLIIEELRNDGYAESFEIALAAEYARLFNGTPILGRLHRTPIAFRRHEYFRSASVMKEIDVGRFLHLFFFADGITGFDNGRLIGTNPDPEAVAREVESSIAYAHSQALQSPHYRGGITLLVGCGWGRQLAHRSIEKFPEKWRAETVSAPDLFTLSWASGFTPLALWRLLDSRDSLERANVHLQNANGLLNLVSWTRTLNEHLVPHDRLPDEFAPEDERPIFMVIEQNSLRQLRRDVATLWDPHRVPDSDGTLVKVRKEGSALFAEDSNSALYISEDDLRNGRLRAVYVAPNRPWWCEISAPDQAPRESILECWRMLCVWLRRTAPLLDAKLEFPSSTAVAWIVRFDDIFVDRSETVEKITAEELESVVQVAVEKDRHRIIITFSEGFARAFHEPENIAERKLVETLVDSSARLSETSLGNDARKALLDKIIPNRYARSMHRFDAQQFRDFIAGVVPKAVVTIDKADDAFLRIGLGWSTRPRSRGNRLAGKEDCTKYLNGIVAAVEKQISEHLSVFSRRALMEAVLLNHEAAAIDRNVWRKTSASMLALHEDTDAALETIAAHGYKLNAVFLASRILLEMGLCECPLTGNRPGQLDLSRLMAQAMLVVHIGGWSDAIRWDAMKPDIRISGLGDILIHGDFIDTVIEPFGRVGSDVRTQADIAAYPDQFQPPRIVPTSEMQIEPEFLKAWAAEFGAPVDEIRSAIDEIENLGIRLNQAAFTITRSELLEAAPSLRSSLDMFTLSPRPSWKSLPEGYKERDIQPWRFRRRLSVLRRPLIRVDDGIDPTYMVAPGAVREGFSYTLSSFHSGAFPSSQPRSPEMRSWIGSANHRQRLQFNKTVANRMIEFGWRAQSDLNVTKLLAQGFGSRNFGDIDVFAWNQNTGRVLVMECKDVQFMKTYGEVAEQLSDFRGEIGEDGKPDLLKKHLDRVTLIQQHIDAVARYTGLPSVRIIESHLVFKNPVPMQFALKRMEHLVRISTFEEIVKL